jgi:RNA recognition motif-containing protein
MNGDYMNMYVGNLAYDVTENDLKELFSQFGEVAKVNIITDNYYRQSKGFGFVDMPNNSEADTAIKTLNGTDFKGRNIKISQAENRRKRSSHKRRY